LSHPQGYPQPKRKSPTEKKRLGLRNHIHWSFTISCPHRLSDTTKLSGAHPLVSSEHSRTQSKKAIKPQPFLIFLQVRQCLHYNYLWGIVQFICDMHIFETLCIHTYIFSAHVL
ncbi:hypothetical protein Pfo_006856, partial [Paulownia fortunei]